MRCSSSSKTAKNAQNHLILYGYTQPTETENFLSLQADDFYKVK